MNAKVMVWKEVPFPLYCVERTDDSLLVLLNTNGPSELTNRICLCVSHMGVDHPFFEKTILHLLPELKAVK